MRKKIAEWLNKPWAAYTFAICSGVLLFVVLTNLATIFGVFEDAFAVLSPIITGTVIAYLVNPLEVYFENKWFKKIKKEKIRHTIGGVVALIFLAAIITLLLNMLIPSVVESVSVIASNTDNYIAKLEEYGDNIIALAGRFNIDARNFTASWENSLTSIVSSLPEKAATLLATSMDVGTGIANGLIGLILAVYFIFGKETMVNGIRRLRSSILRPEVYERNSRFFLRCHKILIRYISYDLVDGIIVGMVNALLMAIFGMPYIALVSVVVAITNLIPTFGPVIGAVIGGFILVLTNPVQALIFLIFTVILQTIDGYMLKPKLFGDTLGVPGVWILITIIIGGKLFGMVGILLSIPFAAIFTFVYEELILPWFVKKRDERSMKRMKGSPEQAVEAESAATQGSAAPIAEGGSSEAGNVVPEAIDKAASK